MKAFLARWRPGHVIAAWVVYWIGLAGVTVTPAMLAITRVSSAPKNSANVSVSFDSTVLHITVTELGKTLYAASASLGQIALWVGVPPLALYALWLFTRRRPGGTPASLGEGDPESLPRPDVPEAARSSTIHSRAPHA
ncbi:MAG TPA: hypothetical protein VF118_00365 [Gemmatimonadaceae bacterium]